MTHERLAEAGAATTGVMTLTAWLPQIEVYLRIGAALVGIVVGLMTFLYYYEAWKEKRKARPQ